MDIGLRDKTVVVTGAAHGIGQDICVGFAANGATVLGVDIVDQAGTVNLLASKGWADRWTAYSIDSAAPQSVRDGCHRIMADHPTIDVLVNNAEVFGELESTPMADLDLEEWDRVMSVNFRGTYLMIRELLPALVKAGGKIVNMASGSALRGSPGMLHYVASKGAIIAMTRSLATELGSHGINVNAVAPGFISTEASQGLGNAHDKYLEMTLQAQSIKQAASTNDVVGTVLYLASTWADAVTGQLCPVDFGLNKH